MTDISDSNAAATATDKPKPFTPRQRRIGIIGLALAVLFFGGLAIITFGEWQRAVALEADFDSIALTAGGTIIERNTHVETRRSSTSSGTRTRRTTVYEVRYRFNSQQESGSNLVYGEQEVSQDFYNSVAVNDTVPVQYMPDDPSVNRVEDRAEDRTMLIVTMGLGGFALIMAVTLGWLIRLNRA